MEAEVAHHDADSDGQIACSILVPVYNEERYIERSVAAMRGQRFAGALEFVFADGGSTDRTREILSRLAAQDSRIRVFENPNRTVSSGLNVALAHSRGRWVARMDAHTEYPEDYVALGIRRLEQGDSRWVSGPQVPTGENLVSRTVALALSSALGRGASRKWGTPDADPRTEFELDTGVFAGVWERRTLLEYGGWDERWRVNEDSEMAARFLARGERLICLPAMAAAYVPRRTLIGLWRQYRAYGEYRAKSAARHPHSMRRSQLLAPALVIDTAMAVAAPRRLRPVARAGVLVYLIALAGAALRALRAGAASEALLLPVVLAVMHFAHGAGFIEGAVRNGPPVAAVASALGLEHLAARSAPGSEPVFNPSLTAG